MDKLAIRSDVVILRDGKVLTEDGELIGGWLKEGDECESGFLRKAKEKNLLINVRKPLHPMILWKEDEQGKMQAVVSLNYLADLEEENGR